MSKDRFCYDISWNLYNFKDKTNAANAYNRYMLARTRRMFEYKNLPETIPARNLELLLQVNGFACITDVPEQGLYAFYGGLGGEPNVYYMPTQCIVNNPALNYNKILEIDRDCIIIPNDSMYLGLMPMFTRYSTSLVESDLTMWIYDVINRATKVLAAQDDNTQASASLFIKRLFDGDLSIVAENKFLDGLAAYDFNGNAQGRITDLIEYHQYLKASWYNDLGLKANYNMKRERLTDDELSTNEAALLPLVDDMLSCRQKALEKINEKYGTNISVKLSSSWEDTQEEIEQKVNNNLEEGGSIENPPSN